MVTDMTNDDTHYDLTLEERERLARDMIDPLLNEQYDVELRFVDAGGAIDSPNVGTKVWDTLVHIYRENTHGHYPTAQEVADELGENPNMIAAFTWRMVMGGLLTRRRWDASQNYEYRLTNDGSTHVRENAEYTEA